MTCCFCKVTQWLLFSPLTISIRFLLKSNSLHTIICNTYRSGRWIGIIIIETVILCIAFFLICFWGTGTDNKNLKSYSSYPDEVQNRIKSIAEYQGKFKESNKVVTFISNFLLFLFVLFILGLFIKENGFTHNFLCLSIIGQGLNIFDLFIVDLLWWRNTKRVRLRKMPEKELYQNPKKHIEAFIRAFIMYLLIALIDGYILTLL